AEKVAKNFTDTFKELNDQINSVSSALKSPFEYQNEQLNILWWYEAKYSQSFFKSYREIDPLLNPLVMAIDLLQLIKGYPAPVSSTYILAESINQTENANYDTKYPLIDILKKIRENKAEL
ncbi:TPA: GTPase-associated system all-helical protein GASH, partial [Acinetobacter baumannii]